MHLQRQTHTLPRTPHTLTPARLWVEDKSGECLWGGLPTHNNVVSTRVSQNLPRHVRRPNPPPLPSRLRPQTTLIPLYVPVFELLRNITKENWDRRWFQVFNISNRIPHGRKYIFNSFFVKARQVGGPGFESQSMSNSF